MRILLDTHALLWLQTGDTRLSGQCKTLITDPANECFFSVVSAWEMTIKAGLKKLALSGPFPSIMSQVILTYKVRLLAISLDDCAAYEQLPFPNPKHRDPFDRMLVVQADRHELSLLSADTAFDAYGVTRLW